MIERIAELRAQAEAEIGAAPSTEALEELRVRYLGRKAELPRMLRGVAELEPERRGEVGKAANEARQTLERQIEERATELSAGELEQRLAEDRVDVTLPGAPPQPIGGLHVLTSTRRELEDIFLGLGFTVMEGPEVETVHYNFDALNHSPTHPARARTDTFYVDEDLVLAQAAIESWWRQDTLGDWTGDATRCAPGRGPGADGRPGQCPESFGILQNRYPYEKPAWPGIASSTAMNADLAYAIWRTCFDGYEGWLNTVDRGRNYAAGDAWGCVGRWFSGRWHVAAGDQYVGE